MLKTKRSELLRLFVVFALLAVTVGIVLISAAKVDTSPQLTSPSIVRGTAQTALHNTTLANHTINFTITVSAGSNTVVRADFNRPAAFSVIDCPVLTPAGWTCTKDNADLIRYQNADPGLAAGGSATFGINGTVSATSQNVSWTIDTYENTGGTIGANATKSNVTVDADAPLVTILNVTDGRHMFINRTNISDGSAWVAYRDLTFNVSISDIFYNVVNVSVYFNLSNVTPSGSFPLPNPGVVYNKSIVRLTSANPAGSGSNNYNGTLVSTLSSASSASLVLNSTYRIYFAVVANDSAGNINITNGTATNFFNISVDGAAPVAYFPTRARGFAVNDILDAAADNITQSAQTHNFSILVYDYEGSGVKNVWINVSDSSNPSGTLTAMGSNNCGGVAAITVTGETCWNISSTLQTLGNFASGDRNVTISYVLNDTVGNLNYTHETPSPFTMNVLVDDPDYAIVLTTNLTNNFTTTNLTDVNITALINVNLNTSGTGQNISITGPNEIIWNLTFSTSTARWAFVGLSTERVFQSRFYSSNGSTIHANGTNSSIGWNFGCLRGDGIVCPLKINWTDLFGRANSTNISFTIDNIPPLMVNFTVENATNDVMGSKVNASGDRRIVARSTDLLNFTVNVQNNVVNVTLHNASSATTNSTLMGAGGERNFSLQIRPTALCITEGPCRINVSAIDSAFNFNRSGTVGYTLGVSSITIIVDDTAPSVPGELGNTTTLTSHIRIGNRTGIESNAVGANMSGYDNNLKISRGINASVVAASAIINISVIVNDTFSNVTLVSIANSSGMNLSRGSGSTHAIELWQGQNSTNELCGLTGASVETTCTLVITAKDNVSNTNSTTQFVVRVDSLAPRVLNFSTNLTISHKVTGSGHQINFSVNISDMNLAALNVSITNNTPKVMNRSGAGPNDNSTTATFWVVASLSELGCTADGNCTVFVVANDSVNNANNSVSMFVQLDSTTISTVGMNLSPTTSTSNPLTSASPTLWINLTTNSLCRYSNNSVAYGAMTPMTGNSSTIHSASPGLLSDATYTYYFRCADILGVEPDNVFPQSITFTIQNTTLSTVGMNLSPTTSTSNPLTSASPTLWINLTTNSLCRYASTSVPLASMTPMTGNNSGAHSASVGPLADGTYTYYFRCTDVLEVEPNNFLHSVTFAIDDPTTSVLNILNVTTDATFITSQPTVHVNTSVVGLCRYSTTAKNYSGMENQFGTEGSTFNSFTLSDTRDNSYTRRVSCTNSSNIANVNTSSTANDVASFTIDTRSLWNITVGATGALSAANDYFTSGNKFYTFTLPNTNVLATTSLNGGTYNVTVVLTSIMGASPGSASTNNLSVLWAYNRTGNSWSSFVYGRATNTFTNFTADVFDYYINLTNGSERIEIN